MRLTLDAHSLASDGRNIKQEIIAKNRSKRFERVKALELDQAKLVEFLKQYENSSRESLKKDGYLLASAPENGTDLIPENY